MGVPVAVRAGRLPAAVGLSSEGPGAEPPHPATVTASRGSAPIAVALRPYRLRILTLPPVGMYRRMLSGRAQPTATPAAPAHQG
ncbi:hypothetical protein ADK86_27890 [Streptomyces sp. NRRL F-5755]|nr:hypothetical protein ADK86_27890 [Streptomyces sp. NRRL F-5755]